MDKKSDVQYSTSVENVTCYCKVMPGGQEQVLVGKKGQTLKDVMAVIGIEIGTGNYVLCADVKGHPGQVIVPPSLYFGWLEERTVIKMHKIPKSKRIESSMAVHQRNLPKFDQQTIFFITMDDRKGRPPITTISYNDYQRKDLCVSANDNTFLEALKEDGRFTNPENFELLNDVGKSTSIHYQAKDFPNKVFSVRTKRSGNRKRDADPRDSKAEVQRIVLSDFTNTASDGIGCHGVIVKEETDDDTIPTTSVTEEAYLVVVTRVKSKAYELFLGPSEAKNEKTRDKAICDFVKNQFSKTVDQSKSAWLIERIAAATKLVGRIFCGRFTATCFLVTKDIVMTNLHVYHGIQKVIQNSVLPDTYKKATVRFNDKYPNQVTDLDEVEVNIDEVIAKSADYQLDYVLLQLRDHSHQVLKDQVKLCDVVFQNVAADQADGLVTIIGHPGGQPKAVDTDCRIVSEYLWRDQVQKRVQKNVAPDSYFYLSQKIKKEIMSDEYEHRLAYDTSFFDGASGSPVFNHQGLVIAMHTCGYEINKVSPNAISVMEFGVSLAAIFNDLYQKTPCLATWLFPHYEQPMIVEP